MGLRSQNNPIASFRDVFSATGKDAMRAAPAPAAPGGITATGGVISDYTEGSTVYRAHIFTSTGELDVTSIGALPAQADFVVIGGGGAGGSDPANNGAAGGGGAGGYRTSMPEGPGGPSPSAESKITLSVQPYTITVGGGGVATGTPGIPGFPGNPSTFSTITSQGGGGGGASYVSAAPWNGDGRGGGSGGGAASQNTNSQVAGDGNRVTDPDGPAPNQGYPGGLGHTSGTGTNTQRSGGGGGAGAAGIPATTGNPTNGGGGSGKTSTITGTSTNYAGGGTASNDSHQVPVANNPGAPYGGGSSDNLPNADYNGVRGAFGTGGGGSGNGWDAHPNPHGLGGDGGSGLVVVRYQIAQLTAQAKATGGAISFYNGKTIHTFTSSGSFVNTAQITDAEFVLVGGGGAGGYPQGGGGGAGGMVVHTGPFTIPGPATNQVVVGGGGGGLSQATPANPGTTTTLTFPGTPVTYSAYRGGGSGPAPLGAMTGGSGGGGSYNGGVGKSATNPAPNPGATEYGNAGAPHDSSSSGGGGGGAGAAGSGADAGRGRQLPTTYRNPASVTSLGTPGPNPEGFYVAGGGAAFYGPTGTTRNAAAGGGGGGPITYPQPLNVVQNANNGRANTGGGGAGPYITYQPNTYNPKSGNGGSGIVLIAYPS